MVPTRRKAIFCTKIQNVYNRILCVGSYSHSFLRSCNFTLVHIIINSAVEPPYIHHLHICTVNSHLLIHHDTLCFHIYPLGRKMKRLNLGNMTLTNTPYMSVKFCISEPIDFHQTLVHCCMYRYSFTGRSNLRNQSWLLWLHC